MLLIVEKLRSAIVAMALASSAVVALADAPIGAEIPWTSYEAEAMRTNAAAVGPGYAPHAIETESSAQRYAWLEEAGDYVEFVATVDANALVLRFSLPDAPTDGGLQSQVTLSVNGQPARRLTLSSRVAWLYGDYPFSNDPSRGKPRNFYDELRVAGLDVGDGDVVRIQKASSDSIPCAIDLIDLEMAPPPLDPPADALSVADFGSAGDGARDDTEALIAGVAAARETGRPLWIPSGEYKLTRDIVLPANVTLQGAGMWHTTFVGDAALYVQPDRRVRFDLRGENIHLADFAIVGALDYRNDSEANDGIVGTGCSDSSIRRIWVEHTKVGVWIYSGSNLLVEGCRFRNLIADGVNLCAATRDSVVENCSARGTGDDCFAIWPAALRHGYVDTGEVPGNNVIRRCTGQLTFLANGAAIYGGAGNRIEDCAFIDIGTGCGILISTTFPTADEARGIDNGFVGTTVVSNVSLVRCGGYDHTWGWRGSFQVCMDRRSISGLAIRDVEIRESFSDGFAVIAPGSAKGQGRLTGARLEGVSIDGVGLGAPGSSGLLIGEDAEGWLVLDDCEIEDIENRSRGFEIRAD